MAQMQGRGGSSSSWFTPRSPQQIQQSLQQQLLQVLPPPMDDMMIRVEEEQYGPPVQMDRTDLMIRKRRRALNRATKYLGLDYATYLLKKFRRRTVAVYALLMAEVLSAIIIEPYLNYLVTNGPHPINHRFMRELTVSGIIASLYLGQAISASILGHASDLYGRKAFLIISIIAGYLGVACLGLIHAWYYVLIIRFIQGLCGSVLSLVKASLADIGHQDTQIHTISLLAYTTSAITFARLIATVLHAVFRPLYDTALSSFDPFVVSCLCAAILTAPSVILVCLIKDSNSERKRANNLLMIDQDLQLTGKFGYLTTLGTILDNNQFSILAGLFALNTAAITLSTRELSYHAYSQVNNFGLAMNNGSIAGWTSFICSGIIFWQLLAFKKLTEWYDLKQLYLLGTALAISALIMGSLLPLPYWINGMHKGNASEKFVWLLILVYAVPLIISFVLMMPTLNAMIHIVTLKSQGIVFGTVQTGAGMCQVVAILLSSLLYGIGSQLNFPWISSIISLCLLLISFFVGLAFLNKQYPFRHHVHLEDEDRSQMGRANQYENLIKFARMAELERAKELREKRGISHFGRSPSSP